MALPRELWERAGVRLETGNAPPHESKDTVEEGADKLLLAVSSRMPQEQHAELARLKARSAMGFAGVTLDALLAQPFTVQRMKSQAGLPTFNIGVSSSLSIWQLGHGLPSVLLAEVAFFFTRMVFQRQVKGKGIVLHEVARWLAAETTLPLYCLVCNTVLETTGSCWYSSLLSPLAGLIWLRDRVASSVLACRSTNSSDEVFASALVYAVGAELVSSAATWPLSTVVFRTAVGSGTMSAVTWRACLDTAQHMFAKEGLRSFFTGERYFAAELIVRGAIVGATVWSLSILSQKPKPKPVSRAPSSSEQPID